MMTLARKYLIPVDFLTKTDYNAKTTETEGKIPSITFLATTAAALNVFESKISNVRNLFKKTDYDAKICGPERTPYLDTFYALIEFKDFNTSNYSKFANEILNAKAKENKLVNKSDFLDS